MDFLNVIMSEELLHKLRPLCLVDEAAQCLEVSQMELACFESKDLVHASLILSGLDVLLRVIVHSWANKDLLLVAVAWRLKVNL